MNAIERLREALAVGWPEGHHEEPNVFTRADDALAAVDALYQAAKTVVDDNPVVLGRSVFVALAAAVRRVEEQA